ncbi:response regulator receiver modulated diguanylate cyclase [Ruegeria faecimaris]|uniref:diguanylate cyclase n=2 Tax=Ruegeria faecimaris TaxID=686389 RepID=A0A521BSQ4_9RHOB|nr:response regulator receiver modulated diguanylate cyclase [Ruegeria faecimaris]
MQSTVTDMSVQGTILVLDGTSTNRIMLKVQLTAAWYHVAQGENLRGLDGLLKRVRPDLILTAQSLPDGTAADVKKVVMADPDLADIPIVAIAPQNDKSARLRALSDGLDDVLAHPFKDTLLLARVRSLLRARADTQELQDNSGSPCLGFAEATSAFATPPKAARAALLTQSAKTGALWQKALSEHTHHSLSIHTISNLHRLLSGPIPDAIIVEIDGESSGLSILADLKSRGATRHTVLIGILRKDDASLAAEALDRGADAICMAGFCPRETLLRLDNQLARKSRIDQMRDSLRRGIAESWVDPLTGLHNRRYAMRALKQIARQSAQTGLGFTVMVADLDHFKSINDKFGHAGGDQVLIETAERMRNSIGSDGFVARIGGEEFLIGLPETTGPRALGIARTVCDDICQCPFDLSEAAEPIAVTISIGLITADDNTFRQGIPPAPLDNMIKSADTALYAAKKAGRNQVMVQDHAA